MILIILGITSCQGNLQKDMFGFTPEETLEPFMDNGLKTFWKHRIYNEGEKQLSIVGPTELLEEGVVFKKAGISDSSDTLVLLNPATGIPEWKWSNYVIPGSQKASSYYDYYHDGILCYNSQEDNYGIDVKSGRSIWSMNQDNISGFLTGSQDGLIFKTQQIKRPETQSSIFVGNYKTGSFVERVRIKAEDGYNLAVIPNVSSFKNESNENVIIFFFQQEGWFDNVYKSKVDYYAYNLDRDKYEWHRENLNPTGLANKTPPIIDDSGVFVAGGGMVYKLELSTGNTLWSKEMPWAFDFDNYYLYKGKLIFNLGNGDLMAISSIDGTTFWHNKSLSGCCASPIVKNDRIYFANGSLHIVDVNSGEALYRINPKAGSFLTNPAVDVENNRMFGTDGVYFYCWELPE